MIVGVIVVGTWDVLTESLNMAFDAVPKGVDPHDVREYLQKLPGVNGIHDLHIWAMSTTETALTAHLVMPDGHQDDHFLQQRGRRSSSTGSASSTRPCRWSVGRTGLRPELLIRGQFT